jgi:hypothetical protein
MSWAWWTGLIAAVRWLRFAAAKVHLMVLDRRPVRMSHHVEVVRVGLRGWGVVVVEGEYRWFHGATILSIRVPPTGVVICRAINTFGVSTLRLSASPSVTAFSRPVAARRRHVALHGAVRPALRAVRMQLRPELVVGRFVRLPVRVETTELRPTLADSRPVLAVPPVALALPRAAIDWSQLRFIRLPTYPRGRS